MRHGFRPLAAAFIAAILLVSMPAAGQPAPRPQDEAPLPPGITLQEFQGVSCLAAGGLSLVAAWVYSEAVLMAAVAGSSLPVLVPIMATAFVAGCGVGSIMSPGLLWIYRRLE